MQIFIDLWCQYLSILMSDSTDDLNIGSCYSSFIKPDYCLFIVGIYQAFICAVFKKKPVSPGW